MVVGPGKEGNSVPRNLGGRGRDFKVVRARPEECFFWRTHAGAEIDLLVVSGRHRLGFEIKRTTAPQVTPSMRAARSDLKLNGLDVVHAGDRTFPLTDRIRAVALSDLLDVLEPSRA